MPSACGPALRPALPETLLKRGFPPMPGMTPPLPASLAGLLAVFGLLSTAPSFRTFRGRACGFPCRQQEIFGVRRVNESAAVLAIAAWAKGWCPRGVSEAQGLPIGHDSGISLTNMFVLGGAR